MDLGSYVVSVRWEAPGGKENEILVVFSVSLPPFLLVALLLS
jgi:hypothetical protein